MDIGRSLAFSPHHLSQSHVFALSNFQITLVDFQILNQFCIGEINYTRLCVSGFQIFVGIIIYSTFWSLALWVCVCTHTRVHECMSWLTHLQVSEQNMDVDSSDLAADAFAWWDTLPAFTLFFWNRICHWTWNFLKDKSGWPVSFKDLVISIPPGSGIIGTGCLCA